MDFIDDYDEGLQEDYFPKKKRETLDIPEFLQRTEDLPTEEQIMAQAMLNNVPNNTEIEKQNHLAELDRACQNWDEEERKVVISRMPSHEMITELDRRMEYSEMFIANNRANLELLASQKL